MMMARLTVAEKRFGTGPVLFRNLSLTLAQGEWLTVMGPSGIGKSTLITILAGVDQAYSGERVLAPACLGAIGTLFQAPRLMPWLTVRDNVALVLPYGSDAARIEAVLALVELQDWRDAYPHTLSGGMQKRVALARALVIAPQLLILDEPFASLDAALGARIYRRMRNFLAKDASIVMVTHQADDAAAFSDRVLHLTGRPATFEVG